MIERTAVRSLQTILLTLNLMAPVLVAQAGAPAKASRANSASSPAANRASAPAVCASCIRANMEYLASDELRGSTLGADPEPRDRVLASRDDRRATIDRHRGRGRTLVVLSLAVPGPKSAPPGAGALFAWAAREVGRAFPGAKRLDLRVDALGPFALWSTRVWPDAAKARCVALEASQPAARLVDLDVYSPGGEAVDRASLLLQPRPCLCCGEPARDCLLEGAHPLDELTARARELLAGLDA